MALLSALAEHYSHPALTDAMTAALLRAGKDLDALSVNDLTPLDQFHTGGKPATLELAEFAKLGADDNVLDLGGCIGGTARILASTYACRVMVLEPMDWFCRTGAFLTARTGLADRIQFTRAMGESLPLRRHAFDAVIMQFVGLNIEDKAALIQEIARVLRPGGSFAFLEVLSAEGRDAIYPVGWSRLATTSFLPTEAQLRGLLSAAGLRESVWKDMTEDALQFNRTRATAGQRPATAVPPIGFYLFGETSDQMAHNVLRNLEEGRIRMVQAVFSH